MMSKEAIQKHFDEAAEVLSSFNNATNIQAIHSALVVMVEALRNGNKIYNLWNNNLMKINTKSFTREIFQKMMI